MNEEEKRARAFLRFYVSDIEDEYFDRNYHIDKKSIKTILNLIEKQQKEIENLKETLEYTIETLEAKPYTAFTAQGDILWDGLEIAEKLKELLGE